MVSSLPFQSVFLDQLISTGSSIAIHTCTQVNALIGSMKSMRSAQSADGLSVSEFFSGSGVKVDRHFVTRMNLSFSDNRFYA